MINLSKFSTENLERIQKVLKIILDELEFQGINELIGNKIPLEKFLKEKLCYDDIMAILNYVNKEKKIVWVVNKYLKKKFKDERIKNSIIENEDIERWNEGLLKNFGVSEEDLKNYIILRIENLDKLTKVKENVDKKLKEGAKSYAEEMKRQLEELNEKQKEKEVLSRETLRHLEEKVKKSEERKALKKEIIEELEGRKEMQSKNPFCVAESRWGYLKFGKYSEKVKVGKSTSRHFRLLQCLLESFGKAKTTEAVYEWIKLLKDKKDPDLSGWDNYKKKNRQIVIIQNAIKELQKGNKLRRKLAFEFDDTKTKIWIKSLE